MTARKGEVYNHRSEEQEAHGYLGRDPSVWGTERTLVTQDTGHALAVLWVGVTRLCRFAERTGERLGTDSGFFWFGLRWLTLALVWGRGILNWCARAPVWLVCTSQGPHSEVILGGQLYSCSEIKNSPILAHQECRSRKILSVYLQRCQ